MIERYVVSYKLGIQITHEDYLYLMTHHTRFSACVFSPSPSLSVTHLYIRVCLCNCCVYQLRPFPSGSYIVVAVLRSDLPLQTLRLQATVHRSAHRPSQSASTATRSVHSCCVKRIASFGRWHRGRQEQDLRRPDDRHLAKNRQSESPEPNAVPRVRHVRVYGYRQMCVAVLCLRARAHRADGGYGNGGGGMVWDSTKNALRNNILLLLLEEQKRYPGASRIPFAPAGHAVLSHAALAA